MKQIRCTGCGHAFTAEDEVYQHPRGGLLCVICADEYPTIETERRRERANGSGRN